MGGGGGADTSKTSKDVIFVHFCLIYTNSSGTESLCLFFDWQTCDLSDLFSSVPAGRRWAAGRSPSVPPRTAGSRWSAGFAWSPEEATGGGGGWERETKDKRQSVVRNSHQPHAERRALEQRRMKEDETDWQEEQRGETVSLNYITETKDLLV